MSLLLSVSFERRYQAWHSRRALGDKVVFMAIWFFAALSACIRNSLLDEAELEHISGRGALQLVIRQYSSFRDYHP